MSNESLQDQARQHSRLYRVFVNPEERRLRAGWRLLGYGLLLATIMPLAPLATSVVFAAGRPGELPPWAGQVLFYALYLLAVLLVTALARRFLDRRPFLDLGLRLPRGWWADLLFGTALGGLLMAAIAFVEWAAGWLEFGGFAWQAMGWGQLALSLTTAFFVYGVVGINEELMMRGYVLQNLAEGLNMAWAVVISSAVFGLLHLGNPYASWISTANIAVAGVFLAAGYLVTRSLWLPIGLHFGWNFFQGTVFGFPVSGTDGFHLIRQTVAGPAWITGGPFGPEAGITGLVAMAVGTALTWLYGTRNTQHRSKHAGY
ncbi:MAG: CPBP family intramembrane metalloprotease [Anaerolineae bacterium]|nr:CPBP family intramembrane metalloprotease [Anaerolineae bacterium]